MKVIFELEPGTSMQSMVRDLLSAMDGDEIHATLNGLPLYVLEMLSGEANSLIPITRRAEEAKEQRWWECITCGHTSLWSDDEIRNRTGGRVIAGRGVKAPPCGVCGATMRRQKSRR